MIPHFALVPGALYPLLPSGIHRASLQEVYDRYVINQHREKLFDGLKSGLEHVFSLGSPQVFLDGSFITAKPYPNDYEIVWDVRFVDPNKLDPVLTDFDNGRLKQKEKYFGEYFPLFFTESNSGKPFLEFFQLDQVSGSPKGILQILNFINGGGKP